MSAEHDKASRFLDLHQRGNPLLIPNPWDAGAAKLLESMGFKALATTSGGFAATLGRLDGTVTRAEAIAHSTVIVAATEVPVSADLENGFAHDPDGVAETVRLALAAGLAGCSIEDHSPGTADPIYPLEAARDRVKAAAEVAHGGGGGTAGGRLVLTARSENYLNGRPDLADTIARLQAFQEAGADVLYAPGLTRLEDIRAVVSSVDRPVNVLALPGVPPVAELAEAGVARVSIGSTFAWVGLGAVVQAAEEFRDRGTYGFWALAGAGSTVAKAAFGG